MIHAANSAALSALNAFSTRIHSNADNTANANTNEFKKTRVNLASVEPQGVKTEVQKINTEGAKVFEEGPEGMEEVELSNVELSQEIPGMMVNQRMYEANLKTLQVTDEMTGSLLKLKA